MQGGNQLRKIFIDPGHGGHDPGAVANGMREADIVLEIGLYLNEILKASGLDTRMSRESNISPQQRWQIANQWGADMLVSIHVNAGSGTGVETLIPTASPNNPRRDLASNRRLAEQMSFDIGQRFGMRLRRANGVMLETETRHPFVGVLRNSNMLAVLPEIAFIDSPPQNPDVNVLRNMRREVAETLAGTILSWYNIPMRTALQPTPEHPFIDVPRDHWSTESLRELHTRGIINGSAPGILGGFGQPMPTERVAAMMWNMIRYLEGKRE